MTAPSFDHVEVGLDGHVATVTLNTGQGNYLSPAALAQIADAFAWADETTDVRALILRSAGRNFCAGVDFKAAAQNGQDRSPAALYEQAKRLIAGRKPVVAAIQGAAVGAGVGLAMIADMRIVGPHARFMANFARLGFHAGFGLSATLPWVIGAHRAGLMLMDGGTIDAQGAVRLGLADVEAEEDALLHVALEHARRFAANAPLAVQSMRSTMRAPLISRFLDAIDHELAVQTQQMQSSDFLEGTMASMSRREPRFTGA